MTDIKSMNLPELTAWFKERGQPAFRAKQVFKWFYRGVTSFEEMSDLPKALREELTEQCIFTPPKVARKQVSAQDGTIKYLWELGDGNCVESVLMRYQHGNTVCISCQVGCRMGCAFCASTIAGKVRNLTGARFPFADKTQVFFATSKANLLYDWKEKKVVWSAPRTAGSSRHDFCMASTCCDICATFDSMAAILCSKFCRKMLFALAISWVLLVTSIRPKRSLYNSFIGGSF